MESVNRPPPRVKGLLGPDTGDELPVFGIRRVPFVRSEVEEFTVDDAAVVLDGDGSPGGHGYHRYGSGIKPSEFPPMWDVEDVVDIVNAIIDDPADGLPGLAPGRFSLFGSHRGLVAVVRLRDEAGTGWRIATVHPFPAVEWQRERKRVGSRVARQACR